MRVATVRSDGRIFPVAYRSDREMVDLTNYGLRSLLHGLESGVDTLAQAVARALETSEPLASANVEILAPIPRTPRNIFCVGANYKPHIDEGTRTEDHTPPDFPVYFTKPFTTLRGTGERLSFRSEVAAQLDWEAEIAVIVGSRIVNASRDAAREAVFGLTLANDLSARDLQLRSGAWGQWFKGKSLDGACPMGPAIVTLDDFGGEIPELDFELRVNGTVKQRGSTSQQIFDIPTVLADLSIGMELLPGDIVMTGTPAGVGLWADPPEFLQDGDHVVVESDALGTLENWIVITQ